MDVTVDRDLELLMAAAQQHLPRLTPMASVHLSAALDALTDPLAPPALAGVDPAETADLTATLHAARRRFRDGAQRADSPQRALALGVAARELSYALAALPPAVQDDQLQDGVGGGPAR